MKITLEQIVLTGIHLGHPTCYWNPTMSIYIYGVRNGIHIIDLVKTRQQLKKAREFVIKVRGEGKEILFVGTKSQAALRIKERALSSQSFFVKERWLGGILTNWCTVQRSILQLHRLERSQNENLWDFLPKKEKVAQIKRLNRLDRYLGGLKGMRSLPRVVIIVGQITEQVAIQECYKLGIPIVCILDTDCDPKFAEIGIPINDDSTSRIRIFLEVLLPRIQEGRRLWLSKSIQPRKKTLVNRKRVRTFRKKRLSKSFFYKL